MSLTDRLDSGQTEEKDCKKTVKQWQMRGQQMVIWHMWTKKYGDDDDILCQKRTAKLAYFLAKQRHSYQKDTDGRDGKTDEVEIPQCSYRKINLNKLTDCTHCL